MPGVDSLGWMMGAGSFLQAFGTYEQGQAAKAQGELAKQNADMMAEEADQEAGLAIGISQRQAIEDKRQAQLVASRSLAVAAASGGGVSDPTVVNVISNAKGEGAYRANLDLYEGEAKARRLKMQAIVGRSTGEQEAAAGKNRAIGADLAAAGTLAYGVGSLYAKYGYGGPNRSGPAKGDKALIDEAGY